MYDDGRHETIESPGPAALGPGESLGAAPFFGPGFTGLNADGERRTDVDVVRAEMVESELDRMIERRDDKRRETDGHRRSEEMYAESVRVYNAARERERRAEWAKYHRQQAERHRATLEALIGHHQAESEKYTENNRHHEEDSCSARKAG
jgi:hypothetical protein